MFLRLDEADVPMKLVYQLKEDLRRDPERVQQTQALTLNASRPCMGLSGRLGLYGSPEWWANIQNGVIRQEIVSGLITRVYISGWGEDEINAFSFVTPYEEVDHEDIHVINQADANLFQVGSRVDVLYCYYELKHQPAEDGTIVYLKEVVEMAVSLEPARQRPEGAYRKRQEPGFVAPVSSLLESMPNFIDLDAEIPMKRVFRLSEHHRLHPDEIRKIQALTLDETRPTEGLSGYRGLYGSNEWWHYVQCGKIRRTFASGVISKVYVGKDNGVESPVLLIDVLSSRNALMGLPVHVNDNADIALFQVGCRVDFIHLYLEKKCPPSAEEETEWALGMLEMAVSLEPVRQG
ncbi:hypothetical protein [Massilia sp. CCM 8734]|uniref:hypothetical protein n=1 Tax=Massilia sp. CCM 8734 TaxID=2609283 RepID=UPI00141D9EDA|nr:hypothetical protein [Massilia sp. CCM 8734]NHZ96740.1 hypothetical protein [Massilia sp. CCM 8734]